MTRVLLLCLCLLLSACGLGRTPPPAYYVLTTDAASEPASTALTGPRVLVGPLTLPGYLDRNALFLYTSGKTQASVKEQAVWGEPILDGVTRILCNTLSSRLKSSQGMAFPLRAAIPATWRLSVDMSRFDGDLNGRVTLEAGWTLTPAHGNAIAENEIVAMGRFVDTLPSGATLDELVSAQSQLLQRFGDALAREILAAEMKKK